MPKRLSTAVSLLLLFLLSINFQSCRTDSKPKSEEVIAPTGPIMINARLRGEPDHLSPYLTARGFSLAVMRHLYLPLVEFSPKTLTLEAVLAKTLPVVTPITEGPYEGGYAYTMEIHDQAVWDNGTPVQASDYIFTLKVINNHKIGGTTAAYRNALNFIRNVEIDPDNPRKFTVLTDTYYLQGDYAVGLTIYPEYAYDPNGLLKDFSLTDLTDPKKSKELAETNENLATFATQFSSPDYSRNKDVISGCGPYQLADWTQGQQLVLKKKENWWGNALVKDYPGLSSYPEQITYKIVADQNTAASMVRNEGFDILTSIPASNFNDMKDSELVNENYNFFTPETTTYNFLAFNCNSPKLNDKRVRRALHHLIDMDKIVELVNQGYGKKMSSAIPDIYEFHDASLIPIEFEVEKAKALLSEAGWTDSNGDGTLDKVVDGERTELELRYITTPGNTVASNIALIFKEGLKKAGVKLDLITMEVNKMFEMRDRGDYDMYSARSGLSPVYYDPYQLWHTNGASNHYGFGDATSDALIEKLRVTKNMEEQNAMFKELQRIIYDEQPMIFLSLAQERIIVHKKFKNAFGTMLSPGYFPHYFHY